MATKPKRSVSAFCDLTMLNHPDALPNLMKLQERETLVDNCFETLQQTINERMREILVSWMVLVCEATPRDFCVAALAVRLLDRYMTCAVMDKKNFQKVGCACLFIAAKARDCKPMQMQTVVALAENSFTKYELAVEEVQILKALNWAAESVLACDLLPHLLYKLNFSIEALERLVSASAEVVNRCLMNFTVARWSAAHRAAGAFWYVLCQPSTTGVPGADPEAILSALSNLTGIPQDCIRQAAELISQVLAQYAEYEAEFLDTPNQ